MDRVVITGIGVISPVGVGAAPFWHHIQSGVSGIGLITRFDTEKFKVKLAAEVKDFEPADFMDKKEVRRSDRFCHFAVASAKLAVDDAALALEHIDKTRCGAIIGSGIGGLPTLEAEHTKLMEKGPSRVSPFFIPMMIPNMAAGMVCIALGIKGPSYCPVSACASSAHALGEAYRMMQSGLMDVCLAGGAEAVITPLAMAGFANMTAVSEADKPEESILPFDKRRNGFVMGEGGCVLVLETLRHARKRDARIYAELIGYGATSDAYHITSPDPDGQSAAQAMRLALREAGVDRVDYINPHGTGTPVGDPAETAAMKLAFGDAAYRIPISATKSMTGHLLGAAGGVEAAVCLLAMRDGIVPPTVFYRQPDPACDLDYVPDSGRKAVLNTTMSNSLGFGGHNASLVFGRCE